VDDRLNGDGTGLIFGINDPALGSVLLIVPTLIFGLYFFGGKASAYSQLEPLTSLKLLESPQLITGHLEAA
jgi:hypothetical protein